MVAQLHAVSARKRSHSFLTPTLQSILRYTLPLLQGSYYTIIKTYAIYPHFSYTSRNQHSHRVSLVNNTAACLPRKDFEGCLARRSIVSSYGKRDVDETVLSALMILRSCYYRYGKMLATGGHTKTRRPSYMEVQIQQQNEILLEVYRVRVGDRRAGSRDTAKVQMCESASLEMSYPNVHSHRLQKTNAGLLKHNGPH